MQPQPAVAAVHCTDWFGQNYPSLSWGHKSPPGMRREQGCASWCLFGVAPSLSGARGTQLPGVASRQGAAVEVRMGPDRSSLICNFSMVSHLRGKAWLLHWALLVEYQSGKRGTKAKAALFPAF